METFRVLRGGRGAPARLASSKALLADIEPVADRVLAAAQQDPSATYSNAVQKRVDRYRGRVRWVITLPKALEKLARRVEAKRGTMRRAARSG